IRSNSSHHSLRRGPRLDRNRRWRGSSSYPRLPRRARSIGRRDIRNGGCCSFSPNWNEALVRGNPRQRWRNTSPTRHHALVSLTISMDSRQVRLKFAGTRRLSREAFAPGIDSRCDAAKSNSVTRQLDVGPVPALVWVTQNAEIISPIPSDPPSKGNPVTPRRWVAEFSVIDPHIDCAAVGMQRGQRVSTTTAVVH